MGLAPTEARAGHLQVRHLPVTARTSRPPHHEPPGQQGVRTSRGAYVGSGCIHGLRDNECTGAEPDEPVTRDCSAVPEVKLEGGSGRRVERHVLDLPRPPEGLRRESVSSLHPFTRRSCGSPEGLDSDPAMHPYLVPLAIHACRERSDKPGSPTHWSNRIIDSLIESPARERDRQGDPRRRSSRL